MSNQWYGNRFCFKTNSNQTHVSSVNYTKVRNSTLKIIQRQRKKHALTTNWWARQWFVYDRIYEMFNPWPSTGFVLTIGLSGTSLNIFSAWVNDIDPQTCVKLFIIGMCNSADTCCKNLKHDGADKFYVFDECSLSMQFCINYFKNYNSWCLAF